MLEFMGKHYYLDVDNIIEICRPPAQEETEQNDDANGKNQFVLNARSIGRKVLHRRGQNY